jgi:prolyl-tRNA editing enzyme YbaK/EbsC (Cys-tRNA(Pro) deacylase)
MKFGTLDFKPVASAFELVAKPTQILLNQQSFPEVYVSSIDPELSDTTAFCEHYGIQTATSANCVIVEAKRGDNIWHVACVVLASSKVDVNGSVRKQVDARKASFAPMDKATTLTSMEYGGITPIGLPDGWTILVDTAVAQADYVIIGSGIRASKLLVPGNVLAQLPYAVVSDITKSQ